MYVPIIKWIIAAKTVSERRHLSVCYGVTKRTGARSVPGAPAR
jgi:hypothetical protein